jgi:hypothetical protein
MSIESYVDNILQDTQSTFSKIVSKVVAKNEKNAQIELVRQYTQVDLVLFEAIKSILNDLKREEGFFSRFLYKYFDIEIFKNKKREQLIILGSELKTKYNNLNREIQRTKIILENLSNSIDNLKKLKYAIHQKTILINEAKILNKSNIFIKKLNQKIAILSEYQNSLRHKYNSMRDDLRIYKSLYQAIPQNQKLKEEYYMNLLHYKKKAHV